MLNFPIYYFALDSLPRQIYCFLKVLKLVLGRNNEKGAT